VKERVRHNIMLGYRFLNTYLARYQPLLQQPYILIAI